MTKQVQNALNLVNETLSKAEIYYHACGVLGFDQETICPPKAMEKQGEVVAFLSNEAYKLIKDPAFQEAAELLYTHREELNEWDRVLAKQLHKRYLDTRNVTPEMEMEFSLIYNKAYVDWLEAKEKADFGLFSESLQAVKELSQKICSLREVDPGRERPEAYDMLLDDYETGVGKAELDVWFGEYKARIVPLLKRIVEKKKVIRTDFLSRKTTKEQQRQAAQYLLEVLGYDFERGAFTTTEHPFTSGIAPNDIRLTTHYRDDSFASNLFTIIHEFGHALFEQLQPAENYAHHITSGKTSGQHESVSRFYENRIGRSREFISLIYPKLKEIFEEQLSDVSEEEFYLAMNVVEPSLIRTEADEFTYNLHIIIRYEMEQEIMKGSLSVQELPALWNAKYKEYLGVEPKNDTEGILQDVHWTFGFGYFPSYAVGNMYNAMYYHEMAKAFSVEDAVKKGDFKTINEWMRQHVFEHADRREPKEWIKAICGREFTTKDYLDYLEEKYSAIYEL